MKKKLLLPLFSDTIKPERLNNKKNSFHKIFEEKPSVSFGRDKKLSHKRDRIDYRRIIEESIEDEE